MRAGLSKKYLCIVVVMLFLIPTVTALNVGNYQSQNNQKDVQAVDDIENSKQDIQDKIDIAPEFLSGSEMSVEVRNILDRYSLDELDDEIKSFLVTFNKQMLERRELYTLENPRMPYEPMDVVGKIARIDPETGESSSFFPNTELKPREPVRCDPNNYQPSKLTSDSPNTAYMNIPSDSKSARSSNTRAPEADIELQRLTWTYAQEGWALQNEIEQDSNGNPVPGDQYSTGGFQIGKTTTFTATVRNNNPGAGSVPVYINFSISEWYTGVPMAKRPTSYIKNVGSTPVTQTFDLTPQFGGDLLIQCLVEYVNDPDTSNNYIGWRGIPVFLWSADLETGTSDTGYGWQQKLDGTKKSYSFSDWTGDLASSGDNIWHITSNPENQNAEAHTQSRAWFHGEDVGGAVLSDTYTDNMNRNIDDFGRNHTYLQTPYINMGDILDDERTVQGLPDNTYYSDYMVMFGMLMTGELEYEQNAQGQIIYQESDVVWACEYNDDKVNDFWGIPPHPNNFAYAIGDYSTLELHAATPQAVDHWNPNFHGRVINNQGYLFPGFPMRMFVSDGNGNVKDFGAGAKNWTEGVRFRLDFTGDGEDDQTTQTGIYADDFVTWGIQDYVVDNRIGFTESSYPKTGEVSILYVDGTASLTVTVQNYGKQKQSVPVKFWIEDSQGNVLQQYNQQKSAGLMDTDDEKDVSFSWVPKDKGEFYVKLEVGDESTDWTPQDNTLDYYIHVSPNSNAKDVDVLVVDDDNSAGQDGSWRLNTEDKMLKALRDNDIEYRVYTVEYNETGAAVEVMDDYELVIWLTGLDNEIWIHGGRNNYNKNNPVWDVTLKTGDLSEIESFLNLNEKKFWLISPGFTYDKYGIDYKTIPPGDFAREYMHIYNCQPNLTQWDDNNDIISQGTPNPLEGVPDSFMDDVEYTTYDMPTPPWGFTDIGGVVEKKDPGDDDTQALFFQDDAHLQHNALLYKGPDHMAVYFAFNFFLLSDDEDTSGMDDAQDCVYRVLTGFGMTGGVTIELVTKNEKLQTVYPGKNGTYQLKVTNLGKKPDAMELSIKITYPNGYPNQYKSWNPRFEGKDVKTVGGKPTINLDGLRNKKEIYLLVTAPTTDDYNGYPDAGERVKFTVTALSENTKLDNATFVRAEIPVLGKITMDPLKTDDTIEVEDEANFPLELFNETNADDDVTVELSFAGDGADLTKFAVGNKLTNNKKVNTILSPNEVNDEVELRVISEENTLAGYHNVTVYLKDESGGETFDEAELTVEVEQFYQVECNTSGDENGESSFIIDPNDYAEPGVDNITKTFTINVRNHGNGFDDIDLEWEENEDSENSIISWPEPRIYSQSGSSTEDITNIDVRYYDETKNPKYGEEEVYFDVTIPLDIETGKYMVDFFIDSSGSEETSLEEIQNNRVTFTFKIIKPNLEYTKLDNQTNPNFEFWDYEEDLQIEEDPENEFGDYQIDKSYKDFDDLTIEIVVYITNNGENDIEIDPSQIWLNITYEDEFGDTFYAVYGNLTPVSPTASTLIERHRKGEFKFLWDPETEPSKEYLEYKFTVTVDPQNEIYEIDEDDNSHEFELWVKHTPKPKKSGGGGGMPGFEGIIMFAAIAFVLLGLMISNRRRRH